MKRYMIKNVKMNDKPPVQRRGRLLSDGGLRAHLHEVVKSLQEDSDHEKLSDSRFSGKTSSIELIELERQL